MSKSFPTGWLVGAIVVLTSLGLAAFLIPFRPCGTCDGLAMAIHFRTSPSYPPAPPPRIDCPDCADRGTVSLFRSWKPAVSPEIGAIVRGLKDPNASESLPELEQLLSKEGMSVSPHMRLTRGSVQRIRPRFATSNDRTVLLLATDSPGLRVPGNPTAGVLLLDLRGRILDYVFASCSSRQADLYTYLLETPGPDGTRIVIRPIPRGGTGVEPDFSFLIHQWRQPPRRGRSEGGTMAEHEGACRIGIRGDRLEALAAEEK